MRANRLVSEARLEPQSRPQPRRLPLNHRHRSPSPVPTESTITRLPPASDVGDSLSAVQVEVDRAPPNSERLRDSDLPTILPSISSKPFTATTRFVVLDAVWTAEELPFVKQEVTISGATVLDQEQSSTATKLDYLLLPEPHEEIQGGTAARIREGIVMPHLVCLQKVSRKWLKKCILQGCILEAEEESDGSSAINLSGKRESTAHPRYSSLPGNQRDLARDVLAEIDRYPFHQNATRNSFYEYYDKAYPRRKPKNIRSFIDRYLTFFEAASPLFASSGRQNARGVGKRSGQAKHSARAEPTPSLSSPVYSASSDRRSQVPPLRKSPDVEPVPVIVRDRESSTTSNAAHLLDPGGRESPPSVSHRRRSHQSVSPVRRMVPTTQDLHQIVSDTHLQHTVSADDAVSLAPCDTTFPTSIEHRDAASQLITLAHVETPLTTNIHHHGTFQLVTSDDHVADVIASDPVRNHAVPISSVTAESMPVSSTSTLNIITEANSKRKADSNLTPNTKDPSFLPPTIIQRSCDSFFTMITSSFEHSTVGASDILEFMESYLERYHFSTPSSAKRRRLAQSPQSPQSPHHPQSSERHSILLKPQLLMAYENALRQRQDASGVATGYIKTDVEDEGKPVISAEMAQAALWAVPLEEDGMWMALILDNEQHKAICVDPVGKTAEYGEYMIELVVDLRRAIFSYHGLADYETPFETAVKLFSPPCASNFSAVAVLASIELALAGTDDLLAAMDAVRAQSDEGWFMCATQMIWHLTKATDKDDQR